MQLNDKVGTFEEFGVKVAALSYDDVEQNAAFAADEELNYALLSDQNARTVRSLGILNTEYEEGHPAFGIPLPGILLVSADGEIKLKRAVPRYQDRPDLGQLVLDVAETLDKDVALPTSNRPSEEGT